MLQTIDCQRTEDRFCLRSMLPLISAMAPKTWIHVAYTGIWEGHAAGGFALTHDTFRSIIHNFQAQANPIPLDWEHASVEPGREAPAAGWVHELEMRGDDLYALVEFGERAAEQVKAGEYKFSSAVFMFDGVNRNTGEKVGAELLSIALTNTPFIDGQEPIKLSRHSTVAGVPMSSKMPKYEKVPAALGLDETASADQLRQALDAVISWRAAQDGGEATPAPAEVTPEAQPTTALEETPSPVPSPDAEEAPPGEEASSMMMQMLAEASGMAPEELLAAVQANLEAVVSALKGSAEEAPVEEAPAASTGLKAVATSRINHLTRQLAQRDERITALTREIETIKRQSLSAEIDALVESGAIEDSYRGLAMTLKEQDPKTFDMWFETYKGQGNGVPTQVVAARSDGGPKRTEIQEGEEDERLVACMNAFRHIRTASGLKYRTEAEVRTAALKHLQSRAGADSKLSLA